MRNSVILLLFLLLASWPAFTQSIGFKVGVSKTNQLDKDIDVKYSDRYKSVLGFTVGATIEVPVKDWLAIESGLQMSKKGYKINYFSETRWSLYYLEIPLQAKGYYKFKSFGIYGLLGPYFGIGLAGKAKDKYTDAQGHITKSTEDVRWGNDRDNSHFKRMDIGLTVGGGITIKRIQVGIAYSNSLTNISPDTRDALEVKNRVLGVEARYSFGK